MRSICVPMLLLFASLAATSPAWAEEKSVPSTFADEHVEFFEARIRPLLSKHCYSCHSRRAKKLQAGLYLDSRAGVMQGGDSGPSVIVGKRDESPLIKAVRYELNEMPPNGKLKPAEISLLERWVDLGAPWPKDADLSKGSDQQGYDFARIRREHWAWRSVQDPRPPTVSSDWPKNSIDQFVLKRLQTAGLKPSPAAELRVLIRRLYLDLIGLVPEPEQIDAFVASGTKDQSAAVAELIDELLASKHYGERWARHWLDVARYSDGYGGFLDSTPLTYAWRYRDWVVDAFNRDLPYDEFVKMQLAGDVIGTSPSDALATGFFALGPSYKSDGGDPDATAKARGETLDDRVDTLSRGLLAITVSCARCHDHKFDPIPQLDYYSLAGIFNNTRVGEAPMAGPAEVNRYNARQSEIKNQEAQIRNLDNQLKKQKRQATPDERRQLDGWKKSLIELKDTAPKKYAVGHGLVETGSGDMRLALRGNLRKPGPIAPRRFLEILSNGERQPFSKGSGRAELAESIVDPQNPLTARVIVNRVWLHHFGQALVRSPSNFGTLGQQPTHPELLDWLASRLIESGWSLKSLHRLILSSATYQMSSRMDEQSFAQDGDNRLIWRMNPRRMDVESWRDSLLTVTGELDRELGGPPHEDITSTKRRTLYARVSRNGDRFQSDVFLRLFDFPIMRATVAQRPTSIVPQQFLFMMNSQFMVERARQLAARLERESVAPEARVERAYRLLFGRLPVARETELAARFLKPETPNASGLPELIQYLQVLLASNEFMHVR